MYLLAWILVGAVVGWGAGRVFQGNGYGPFMDILMGVGGALAGGFLIRTAGIRPPALRISTDKRVGIPPDVGRNCWQVAAGNNFTEMWPQSNTRL